MKKPWAYTRAYDQEIDQRLGDPPSESRHEKSAEAASEVDLPLSKPPSSQTKARKSSSDAKLFPVNPPKVPEPGYEGFASIVELLDGVTGINL